MHSDEVYDLIRKLQPNTLINDRLYKREPGNKADYGTPEQFVPATGMHDPSGKPILWESCVTINTDSWGYNKYETEFKTPRDLIRMLIEVVSKGGNLLLNVGPMPDGRIQDEFVTRLNAIGRWMKVNGESIYGTSASPFARLPFFGRATQKGNTVYLHVFQWPADGQLRVPALKNRVRSARLLASGASLKHRREGEDVTIALPATAPDDVASVVALELDGKPQTSPFVIKPASDGALKLGAESCEIETRFEQRAKKENLLGHVFVTHWTRPDDIPTWLVTVPRAGKYRVDITYASGRGSQNTDFAVVACAAHAAGKVQNTQGEYVFNTFPAGTVDLAAGEPTIQVRAHGPMNLERVVLTPAQ